MPETKTDCESLRKSNLISQCHEDFPVKRKSGASNAFTEFGKNRWTDGEHKLFLEALRREGKNWDSVHVKRGSAALTRFINRPVGKKPRKGYPEPVIEDAQFYKLTFK